MNRPFILDTLILIRHGQTLPNRSDIQRVLTKKGVISICKAARFIKKYIRKNSLIITSNTVRTIRTSEIISRYLKIPISKTKVRIEGIDNIGDLLAAGDKKGIPPAKTYLSLSDDFLKEHKVETRSEFVGRLKKQIPIKVNNVIVVSHEVSLEAILYSEYNSLYRKTFNKYFKYGDVAVLKSVKIKL